MSKTREKKVVDTTNYTKEDAENLLSSYSKSCSVLKTIEGEQELEISAIRNRYKSKIEKLTASKTEDFDRLQIFAETNPEYFSSKKSMELIHGKIGFRTSPPKLKLLKSFNWDRVVEKLEDIFPQFIRTKKEADKDALLSSREDEEVSAKFKLIGIEVVQDESFFVEPKTEDVG